MAAENQDRRVALVTGGAKRVGKAIVEKLAGEGWNVVFTYFSNEEDAHLLQELWWDHRTDQYQVAAAIFDASLFEHFKKYVVNGIELFGRLDLIVNNASIYKPDPQTHDEQFFRDMFAANFETPMRLCEQFGPLLRASRGHVVNMIDLMAERPMPSYSIYCASKAALMNATLSLARKLAPEVTVNGISPGVVAWPDDMPQADREAYLKRVPLGRAGTPQDVANLVHFLATEGSYITGQIIRLDGGRSIVP